MRFALPSKNLFPLEKIADAVKAEEYFIANEKSIPIELRREFCSNVLKYKEELGIPTQEKIASYVGDIDTNKIDSYIHSREYYQTNTSKDLRDILDSTKNPDEVIAKLAEFDRKHNLDIYWDTKLENPVLGITKTAEKLKFYEVDGVIAAPIQIRKVAQNQRDSLFDIFSEAFVDRFIADPIKVFEGLSEYEQLIILNLARAEYT